MLEKHIEAQILAYLRFFQNTYARKTNSMGRFDIKSNKFIKSKGTVIGVADITCDYKRKSDGLYTVIYFEVKAVKGKQSEVQKLFQKNIEDLGGNYFVVRSIEDVKKSLEIVENKKFY